MAGKLQMNIDYSKNNQCIICKILYAKDVKVCNKCHRKVRTTAHICTAEVRERMKKLAEKRY